MHFFDQIKTGGFADPSTLQGAFLFAVIFAFLAWIVGRTLRLAVQRILAHDKHDHLDLMAVKFIAKLTRYAVYVFAFAAYAHFIPALSGLGTASLTSIGMISRIVAFASLNTLGNLIAGKSPKYIRGRSAETQLLRAKLLASILPCRGPQLSTRPWQKALMSDCSLRNPSSPKAFLKVSEMLANGWPNIFPDRDGCHWKA